jgi:hypothetical protein
MASKEELQRLVRAMNPDAEQIEEAAAAAPRVPGAVKALGRGFYEANIAPLLSPYETAMAIFGAGKEMVRAPVETTKSMARSELERLQQAEGSPEAAAEYAGGMFSPFSMLRRAPTMREITAYQASPAKFEPTPNPQLRTPEFKKFFQGSKVVDEEKRPIRLYHATDAENDFDEFDTSDFGSWFAEDPETAMGYANKGHGGAPRTFPVYLNVKKPLYIPEEIDLSEDVNAAQALDLINKRNKTDITLEEIGENPRGDWDLSNQGNEYGFALFGLNDRFVDALKKRGFDGYQAFEQGKSTWNAFSPEQIKSAVGNVGKFDPESPVLTKAQGGEVRPLAKRR